VSFLSLNDLFSFSSWNGVLFRDGGQLPPPGGPDLRKRERRARKSKIKKEKRCRNRPPLFDIGGVESGCYSYSDIFRKVTINKDVEDDFS
jgi:hypothetical protein